MFEISYQLASYIVYHLFVAGWMFREYVENPEEMGPDKLIYTTFVGPPALLIIGFTSIVRRFFIPTKSN